LFSANLTLNMSGNKTIIIGLGNELLSDDGIGPKLLKSLDKIIEDRNIITTVACCGGLELMEQLQGFSRAILLDAIRTVDGKPGNVYYFTPSDFRETSNLSNLHNINFITALHLGNFLELDIPADLHIIAVEISEDREFSENLTEILEARYPQILEEVHATIKQIIEGRK